MQEAIKDCSALKELKLMAGGGFFWWLVHSVIWILLKEERK